MTIIVYGIPAPQGSKKFLGMRGGHGIIGDDSKRTKPWRQDVKYAALQWRTKDGSVDITAPALTPTIEGAVKLRIVFTLPKPASAPKRRKTWACKKPDIDKLLRSTLDALTEAGVFTDDARVVEFSRLAKVFPGEDPEALDVPGCRIDVEAIV